jgi:predicted O-methyltransferase YrrM
MKYITDPDIENYIREMSISAVNVPESEIFERMHEYARNNHFPIIGPMAGRLLRQLAMITKAHNILELGSGYGYSALWFAGGMRSNGRIVCTDNLPANHDLAQQYFSEAGHADMLDFRVGDALQIAGGLSGPFDIILNDIDKEQYPKALEIAIPRLRKGGIFITDNILWAGKILNSDPDKPTQAILEFNRRLFNSPDILSSIIPLRDGLGMAVKIS